MRIYLDQNDDEELLLGKLVKKLKEIDAVAYRTLTVENYDHYIIQSDSALTDSEQQIQYDKIQKDLLKIFEEDTISQKSSLKTKNIGHITNENTFMMCPNFIN